MGADTTLRDTLNTADPNRIASAEQDIQFGEVLNALILGMTPTQSGLSPSSHVTTLANQPKALLDVNVTAGTSTGHKKVIKGHTAPDGTILPVPTPGTCTWDGGVKVRTNVADNATTVAATYTKAADATVSYLQRSLGEQD